MLTEAELLQYIYQTTEMGRDGIQSVLPHAEDETFHQALEQQLTEYEKLYGATGKMLRERGQEPKGLNPMVKASSEMMSAMKTMADHSTSKIAEMMIWTVKQPPRIFSAESISSFPIKIDALGAPPDPTRAAKAETTMMIGRQTPTPVRARLPLPGICPM